MPCFWGFFSFFLKREMAEIGSGNGSWAMGRRYCGGVLSRFARIFGYLVAAGGLRGRLGLLASFFVVLLFQIQKHFKKVRDASRSDYVIPASRPSRKLQAVPGEGFSRAVTSRNYPARRWYSTTLVALRGGCPLSRAVRRPAFAVTVSSVIRGGDEPRGELSVLARKRSEDRGDLSFPVVTGIG